MSTIPKSDLLTPAEAAEYLRATVHSLRTVEGRRLWTDLHEDRPEGRVFGRGSHRWIAGQRREYTGAASAPSAPAALMPIVDDNADSFTNRNRARSIRDPHGEPAIECGDTHLSGTLVGREGPARCRNGFSEVVDCQPVTRGAIIPLLLRQTVARWAVLLALRQR